MAVYSAGLAGALLFTFIVSRFIRWLLFKKSSGLNKALTPNIITLVLVTLAGAFGAFPAFGSTFLLYVPAVAILIAMDVILWLIRDSKKASAPPAAG